MSTNLPNQPPILDTPDEVEAATGTTPDSAGGPLDLLAIVLTVMYSRYMR